MNGFNVKIIVLLAAILVGVARARGGGPRACSTLCKKPCDAALLACRFLSSDNQLCDVPHKACSRACAAVCSCDDVCEDRCSPPMTACQQGEDDDFIHLADCLLLFDVCVLDCQASCAANATIALLS